MPMTLAIWVTDTLIALEVGADITAFIGEAALSPGWADRATADADKDGGRLDGC